MQDSLLSHSACYYCLVHSQLQDLLSLTFVELAKGRPPHLCPDYFVNCLWSHVFNFTIL